jgi:hypothetical protein
MEIRNLPNGTLEIRHLDQWEQNPIANFQSLILQRGLAISS